MMIEILSNPWPWYVSGPMITLVMFLLIWAGEGFGVSSTLRTICSIGGAGKHCGFFNFDWRAQKWNLVFVLGGVIGGVIASFVFPNPQPLALSASTINDLSKLNINFDGSIAPTEIFSWESLLTLKGSIFMILGGFLVGFGARWANGCTSGHAISGLSKLQLTSLITVIGFFIGGLIMTFLIYPLIFKL